MRTAPQTMIFAAISLFAIPLTAQDNRSLVAENFEQADTNNDDKLSPSEFRVLIDENAKDEIGRAAFIKRRQAYDSVFARLDANNDGYVSFSELPIGQRLSMDSKREILLENLGLPELAQRHRGIHP